MNLKLLTIGMVALLALGAAGLGISRMSTARELADAREQAQRKSEAMRTRIASLEKQLVSETKRAEAVESDNAALARAVQTAQAALARPAVATVPTLTREAFDARVKRAVANAQDAEAGAALAELLACWELGKTRAGGLEPVHSTLLLGAWIKLGENHPPALAVLREKMEKARRRILGSPDDMEPLREFAAVARALKDEQALVALYDAIPEGDARRTKVAIYAVDSLIAAKRYREALTGRTYGSMSSSFEMQSRGNAIPGATAASAERMKGYAVTSAAKNIEVLAGAGDLTHARELAGRVLALDNSEATRALVQAHLERAGQPGLLKETGK
jgi:hypothetical protein